MPSRRPPSQRDPAYAPFRVAGTLAQAAPGLKVKNAAPVKTRPPSRAAKFSPAAFTETWARNRFVLTASGAQTLLLSHEPKASPLFVFLNGMYQDEGTDFLLDSVGLQVQTAMGATTGDIVDVRYIVAGPASWLDDMGAAIMADAPDLYWPLTDAVGATSALDISGNGRDGYLWIDGSITFGQPGLVRVRRRRRRTSTGRGSSALTSPGWTSGTSHSRCCFAAPTRTPRCGPAMTAASGSTRSGG
jgi:hypothetical protein